MYYYSCVHVVACCCCCCCFGGQRPLPTLFKTDRHAHTHSCCFVLFSFPTDGGFQAAVSIPCFLIDCRPTRKQFIFYLCILKNKNSIYSLLFSCVGHTAGLLLTCSRPGIANWLPVWSNASDNYRIDAVSCSIHVVWKRKNWHFGSRSLLKLLTSWGQLLCCCCVYINSPSIGSHHLNLPSIPMRNVSLTHIPREDLINRRNVILFD